jgi:hypothetical protein
MLFANEIIFGCKRYCGEKLDSEIVLDESQKF